VTARAEVVRGGLPDRRSLRHRDPGDCPHPPGKVDRAPPTPARAAQREREFPRPQTPVECRLCCGIFSACSGSPGGGIRAISSSRAPLLATCAVALRSAPSGSRVRYLCAGVPGATGAGSRWCGGGPDARRNRRAEDEMAHFLAEYRGDVRRSLQDTHVPRPQGREGGVGNRWLA